MTFKGFTSRVVHHDRLRGLESGAIHAPIFNSVLYGYEDAQDLVDVFQGKTEHHTYARQSTPTLPHLQSLVTMLDAGRDTLLFSSGMAATAAIFLSLLKAGDHLIASRYLFGNTHSLLGTLEQFGIQVTRVDPTETDAVRQAMTPHTRMVFVETVANPGTEIPDLEGIGQWCEENGILFVVDNTLTTSYLFQPKQVGAHLIMTSLTKYFNGHGNVLAGAVTDTGLFNWQNYPNIYSAYRQGDPASWGLKQIKKKSLRDMGASLSSESSVQIALGAETLALRMERACANAMALAHMLDQHPIVSHVYYPGLPNHPQYERATELFRGFGGLLSFDVDSHIDPITVLNKVLIAINATHLGDNRTLALPVAQTIFHEMGAKNREEQGIQDGMIRCSVGIEDTEDLINSFRVALDSLL
ncbi:MAG: cystathionine gamma-synthase family protein [Gammaproteobacteria bacterium]